MKLSLGLVVQLNDAIRISFSPTSRLEATVVWINGSECGVSFKEPIDSAELLSSTAAEVLAGTSRAPRVRINRRATLIAEGKTQMATINDVSQRGMKVTHDGSFRPGLHVTVMLDEHSEYRAVVRWVRDNFAGLMLLEPIGVAALGSARNL